MSFVQVLTLVLVTVDVLVSFRIVLIGKYKMKRIGFREFLSV